MPDLLRRSIEPTLSEALATYHLAIRRHRQEMLAIVNAHSREGGNNVRKAMAGLIEGGNAHIETAADEWIM